MALRVLLSLFLSFAFSSCAVQTARIDSVSLTGTDLEAPAREKALSLIAQKNSEIARFKGLVACTITHDEKRNALRYLIAYQQPDLLRIEQFPTQGFYSLGLFTSTSRGAQYIDPSNKRVLMADSSYALIKSLFNLPLESSEFVALVSGRVPTAWLEHSRVEKFTVLEDRTSMILGKNEVMRVGAESVLEEVRLFDPETRRERIVLTLNWAQGSLRVFPQGFTVRFLNEDALTECTYRSIELNPLLPLKLFEVDPPSDFEVVQSS